MPRHAMILMPRLIFRRHIYDATLSAMRCCQRQLCHFRYTQVGRYNGYTNAAYFRRAYCRRCCRDAADDDISPLPTCFRYAGAAYFRAAATFVDAAYFRYAKLFRR